MKKLLCWLLLVPCYASAQFLAGIAPITGTITSAGSSCASLEMDSTSSGPSNCVSRVVPSTAATASIVLTGTFTATVQFELTADNGRTWVAAPTASSTTAGTSNFGIAGYNGVRARASAFSSGTIAVTISVGTGTIGSVLTGTVGQPAFYSGANSTASSAAWFDVSLLESASVGDMCARISAAETAASTGISLDARAIQGTQACALSPFPSSALANVLLGNVIIQVHQTWCTPSKMLINGIGWSKNPISSNGATVLQATSDLAVGGANPGPVIAWGNAGSCLTGQVIQDARYTNITVDGAGIATTCVQAYNSQEYSGMEGFTVLDCNGGGANVGTSEMIIGAPPQIASDATVSLASPSATITCTGCFADAGQVVNAQFSLATATGTCTSASPCTILSVQSANSATLSATYNGVAVSGQQLTWASASAQNSYFLHGNFGILNIAADCPQSGTAPGSMLIMNTGSGSNMGPRVFDDMTFVNICQTGTPIPPVWDARISGTGFNGRAWHFETALLAGATGGLVIGLDSVATAVSIDGVTCTNMTNATDCVRISNAFANTAYISLRSIKVITPGPTNVLTDQQLGNTIAVATEGSIGQYVTGSTSKELVTTAHTVNSSFSGLNVIAGANGLNTVQFFKNDGTTSVVDVDTTNSRLGITSGTPGATLDVGGAFWVTGAGFVTKAGGLTTASPGVPIVLFNTVSATTNAGANLGSQQMTAGVAGLHTFRFSWFVDQVAAGTGSCAATASTLVLNLVFTDPNAAGTNTLPMIGFGPNTNTAGITTTITIATSGSPLGAAGQVAASGTYTFSAKNNTAVAYTTTGAAAPASCTLVPTYAVRPVLELLQ